jgi:hypothetical protein
LAAAASHIAKKEEIQHIKHLVCSALQHRTSRIHTQIEATVTLLKVKTE